MKRKKAIWLCSIILMLPVIILVVGCKKKVYDRPTVVTSPVTLNSSTSATCGGTITNDGGLHVTSRGVYWAGPSNEPDCADFSTFDGAGSGDFKSLMDNLEPNKTYLVRAYAINYRGTAFGEIIKFTTGP
jgi:hypothetical protein